MNENEEYQELLRQQSQTRSQYNACRDRIDECDYLLRRLRPVKEEIAAQKADYRRHISAERGLAEQKCNWEGDCYDEFRFLASEVRTENDDYLRQGLDRALDALNNRITEIENRRMNEFGLLGRLGSALNSLANSIENFFN